MSRFAGQRVVITGGSQGIGRACAELFAAEGAEVIATYIGDEGAADATATAIRAKGGKIRMIRSDLGKRADNDRLWDEVGPRRPISICSPAPMRSMSSGISSSPSASLPTAGPRENPGRWWCTARTRANSSIPPASRTR